MTAVIRDTSTSSLTALLKLRIMSYLDQLNERTKATVSLVSELTRSSRNLNPILLVMYTLSSYGHLNQKMGNMAYRSNPVNKIIHDFADQNNSGTHISVVLSLNALCTDQELSQVVLPRIKPTLYELLQTRG